MHDHFTRLATPEAMTLARRLDARIEVVGQDWIFTGPTAHHNGYRIIRTATGVARAHRIAYEIAIGPIPDGLHVDHVWLKGCRSRACVRPDHLEAVPQRVNNQRAADKHRILSLVAPKAVAA